MIATESHRPMSSFSDAVKEWNRKSLEDKQNYRSGFAAQMTCLRCPEVGMILTTRDGYTSAKCTECGYSWVLA